MLKVRFFFVFAMFAKVEHSNGDDELDNFHWSPSSSPLTTSPNLTVTSFIEMGFSSEMIARATEETGGEATFLFVLI